ncbi:MAG: hypothetical protein PCFJNLEI_03899 [Verrucomicrobiae bacterium]|nr:hypothetical protein [Verrucomicrobiae bacterium]
MLLTHRVQLRPSVESDEEFCFQVKKKALGAYIEQTCGWDESFQRQLYATEWVTRRPAIIVFDQRDVGTIEIRAEPTQFYLGEFYLLPEVQRQGIGRHLLADLMATADAAGKPIALDVLKVNPARRLYERSGFVVTGSNEHYYQMKRESSRPG